MYITKTQADKALKYLKENGVSEAILWCACCSNDPMVKIKVTKFFSRYTGFDNFYEVIIQGSSEDGILHNDPVDLAYVFLRSGALAKSLGKLLGLKCDPCTLPFDWGDYKNQQPINKAQEKPPVDMVYKKYSGLSSFESRLVGTWKDDNSTFILSSDRTLITHWVDGNTATGIWAATNTTLNLNFKDGKYISNDYYYILGFTGKQ